MANSPVGKGYVPDGHLENGKWVGDQPSHFLSVEDFGTFGIALSDTHTFPEAYWPGSNPPFTLLASVKDDFKIVFSIPDPTPQKPDQLKTIYTFNWGFQWTNNSYAWSAGDNPAPPAGVVISASPIKNGAGSGMLTGYGEGVNFSQVQYVEDIDRP
jgi:hypothetical protein